MRDTKGCRTSKESEGGSRVNAVRAACIRPFQTGCRATSRICSAESLVHRWLHGQRAAGRNLFQPMRADAPVVRQLLQHGVGEDQIERFVRAPGPRIARDPGAIGCVRRTASIISGELSSPKGTARGRRWRRAAALFPGVSEVGDPSWILKLDPPDQIRARAACVHGRISDGHRRPTAASE